MGLTVRIPMMPKGVEHELDDDQEDESADVRIPMMPKGVEHTKGARMDAAQA